VSEVHTTDIGLQWYHRPNRKV